MGNNGRLGFSIPNTGSWSPTNLIQVNLQETGAKASFCNGLYHTTGIPEFTEFNDFTLDATYKITEDGWIREYATFTATKDGAKFPDTTNGQTAGSTNYPETNARTTLFNSDRRDITVTQILEGEIGTTLSSFLKFPTGALRKGESRRFVWQTTLVSLSETKSNGERWYRLDANGGQYPGGKTMLSGVLYHDTKDNQHQSFAEPTRQGYSLIGWSTAKDDSKNLLSPGATIPETGTILYAQWEPDSGMPTKARVDCNDTKCAVTASYANAPSKTRVLDAATFTWPGNGINGVRLDDSGYDAHASCPDGQNYCRFVSLTKNTADKTTTITQTPTTGAPTSDWLWPAGGVTVALVGVGFGLTRRRRA